MPFTEPEPRAGARHVSACGSGALGVRDGTRAGGDDGKGWHKIARAMGVGLGTVHRAAHKRAGSNARFWPWRP